MLLLDGETKAKPAEEEMVSLAGIENTAKKLSEKKSYVATGSLALAEFSDVESNSETSQPLNSTEFKVSGYKCS